MKIIKQEVILRILNIININIFGVLEAEKHDIFDIFYIQEE